MKSPAISFIYCDCFSGISGDMFLGALLDLGASLQEINTALKDLLQDSVEVLSLKERRGTLWGTKAVVRIQDFSHQPKRTFRSIVNLLEKSSLPDWVVKKAVEIFRLIAEAEGRIHNMPPEEVHFHEVGALDSIADIVGSLIGLFNLGIYELISSSIPLGEGGTVETHHGVIPLPAPATLEMLKGLPVYGVKTSRELVTPTGAAILKVLATGFGPIPPVRIQKVGYGVGSHPSHHPPNMLRLIIASREDSKVVEEFLVLESNIDDMPQELYEHVIEKLLNGGALDVWLTPVIMKKGRPAVKISVLCHPTIREAMENILFLETTTAGIRAFGVSRKSLNREEALLDTPWGTARVKVFIEPDGSRRIMPEYESCRELAKLHHVSLWEIYRHCFSANLTSTRSLTSSTASEQKG